MAATINHHVSEANKAKDNAELMECQLRAARESLNDTQQRLVLLAENLMEKSAANDKAMQQLTEMAAKLDAECILKDELQQQLSITTNNLNGALRMESEQRDAKVAAEQRLTDHLGRVPTEEERRTALGNRFECQNAYLLVENQAPLNFTYLKVVYAAFVLILIGCSYFMFAWLRRGRRE
jgi:uncharacterized protein YigA (DUF484 family)